MLEFKAYKDQQKIIEAMKRSIKRLREFAHLCGDSGGEIFYRRAASIEKRLEKLEKLDKPQEKKLLNVDFSDQSRTGHNVLTLNNFNLSFPNKVLFEKTKLELYYKEKACIIGPNGSGKTTLIKEILNKIENKADDPQGKQIGQDTYRTDTAKIAGNQGHGHNCRAERCGNGCRDPLPQSVHQLLLLVDKAFANSQQILSNFIRKQENKTKTNLTPKILQEKTLF